MWVDLQVGILELFADAQHENRPAETSPAVLFYEYVRRKRREVEGNWRDKLRCDPAKLERRRAQNRAAQFRRQWPNGKPTPRCVVCGVEFQPSAVGRIPTKCKPCRTASRNAYRRMWRQRNAAE